LDIRFSDWLILDHLEGPGVPKVGTRIFFVSKTNRKSANSWAHSTNRKSANFCGVHVRKSQIRKFAMINPQIANFLGVLISKSQNSKFARKEAVFLIQIRIGLSSVVYFRLRKAMYLCLKTVAKAKSRPLI
jgi:hypothetical protein